MAGGFLDIAQRHAGVERGGDERVAQERSTRLLIPAQRAVRRMVRAALWRSSGVPSSRKFRPSAAFTRGEIHRPGRAGRHRHGHDLAVFADHGQGAVTAFETEGLDPRADRFGHSKPVVGEQTSQRVVSRVADAGGFETISEVCIGHLRREPAGRRPTPSTGGSRSSTSTALRRPRSTEPGNCPTSRPRNCRSGCAFRPRRGLCTSCVATRYTRTCPAF